MKLKNNKATNDKQFCETKEHNGQELENYWVNKRTQHSEISKQWHFSNKSLEQQIQTISFLSQTVVPYLLDNVSNGGKKIMLGQT